MRNLWVFFLWYVFVHSTAWGQSISTLPARVVTSYALTSVQDLWYERDPGAWRLLASNDGHCWATLDVRTNQVATGAGSRRVFHVQNQKAYRIYRLQIDANVILSSRQVGLAELELLGPVVGVSREVDLQAKITSSQEHPLMGAAVNAFDGEVGTKWIDFAPFKSGGCWLQCEYVRQSEQLISNVNEVRVFSHLAATRALLLEKAAEIHSKLKSSAAQPPRTLNGYALTSANDFPERDPHGWKLLGSDDGKDWKVVDVRQNEIFSSRFHRRLFILNEAAHYGIYRLQIEVKDAEAVQVADLEPLYSDKTDGRYSFALKTSGENAPMEKAEMAFDGDHRSKWFSYAESDDQGCWIQWQCLPAVAGLPLINLHQFSHLVDRSRMAITVPTPGSVVSSLTGYSLTSANDEPGRDPRDWRLLGSNNGGKSWAVLDERRNEKFAARNQKRQFTLPRAAANPAYAIYRLQFNSVAEPLTADSLQLAEIEPLYSAERTNHPFSTVVSAQADNEPWERIERAFDGDPKTKWLDPSQTTNRASWVQWYLVDRQKSQIIPADSSSGIQPGLPGAMKLQLEGVAVCASSNILGFLDESGLQMFQLRTSRSAVKTGDQLRLTGGLQFGVSYPQIQDSQLTIVGSLTNQGEIRPDQLFASQQPFSLGSAEGKVTAVAEGQIYTTIRLAPDVGSRALTVRILNLNHVSFPIYTDCKLRVRGVIEPVFEKAGRYPGILWVAGMSDVVITPPAASNQATEPVAPILATNELTSIRQINDALKNEANKVFNVKVRGVITYIDLGLIDWYLQDGADGIYVQDQFSAGLSPFMQQDGTYVELQGTIGGNNDFGVAPSAFVKVLGKGRMPTPLQHSLDYLMTGNDDSKWVQVTGVVTAFEKQRLTISVNGGRLVAWVNEVDHNVQNRLLGSVVRVSGVCSPVLNHRRQRLGVRLLVPSAEYVEIVKASPEDPFDLTPRSISSLMHSGLSRGKLPEQLVKISGVVTYQEPRQLFVQNATNGLRILLRRDSAAHSGDAVDVVGFAEMDGLSPKLVQALVRIRGQALLPMSVPIDPLGMNSVADQAIRDATRATVEATLLGRTFNEEDQVLHLKQEKTDKTFLAYLPIKTDILSSVPMGSRVRLEGVFKAKMDSVPDFGQLLTSFEMYLNSLSDITVLERPPWWSARRTLWLLGSLGLVLIVALAWAGLLRKANRELEQRVQERTAKLHEAVTELEHFSYTITHDMRAPLRAMKCYGDILLEQNEDMTDESKQFIGRINSAAGRMDNLITDALDYSKLVRQDFVLLPVDCEELLHEILVCYPQYREVKSGIRVEGPIPRVQGNEAALTQCFSNLLNNAIKFVEPGKKPEIRIWAEERDEHVRLWFHDNGIGVPKEYQERIFAMFQRINPKYEGTGIGLALVRKAAERMGGKVGVESDSGKGSRFWLEFKKSPAKL